MNISQIVTQAVSILITALAYYVWNQYVRPWLQQNRLMQAAQIAVRAAQALYGRYNGQQKLDAALQTMKQKGWDVQKAGVFKAVQAAWQRMNTQMLTSGQKDT